MIDLSSANAFFFDLDGTIVDTSTLHEQAYQEVLGRRYPALARKFTYESAKGQKTTEVMARLGFDERTAGQLAVQKQKAYRKMVMEGKVTLLPYMQDILRELVAQGKRLYLITGASRESVELLLASLRIERWFVGMVCAEDFSRSKPDPESYRLALEKFSVSPEEAVVVEDSENGVRAAIGAGIRVISVDVAVDDPRCTQLRPAMFYELVRKGRNK